MPAKRPDPEKQVATFNNLVNIGDEVDYIDHPGAAAQRFKTQSAAEVMGGHTAVVWLEGKRGCVSISHCTPVRKAA